MSTGILTLVPTPINEQHVLEQTAWEQLQVATTRGAIIAVEEIKIARRRWLAWKLPRDYVDSFWAYNEHTAAEVAPRLLDKLLQGSDVFIMSDGGLPAFCDPGRRLVDLCHQHHVRVTSTPFCNSVALAVALSGFDHKSFYFAGFLSPKRERRQQELQQLLETSEMIVLMDTPYRLSALLTELEELIGPKRRQCFFAGDLNTRSERLLRGSIGHLKQELLGEKREFILIIQ